MRERPLLIPVFIDRAADDAYPRVRSRITAGERVIDFFDPRRQQVLFLPVGEYALIVETEGSGERDGAALRIKEASSCVKVRLRAQEAAPGHVRVMIDAIRILGV